MGRKQCGHEMDTRRVASGVGWRDAIPVRWRIASAPVALHAVARALHHAIPRTKPCIMASRRIEPCGLHRGVQQRARIHLSVACGALSRCGSSVGVDMGIVGKQKVTQWAALDCFGSGIERRGAVVVARARGEFSEFARGMSWAGVQHVVDELREAEPKTFRQLERSGSDSTHDVAGCGMARANRGI